MNRHRVLVVGDAEETWDVLTVVPGAAGHEVRVVATAAAGPAETRAYRVAPEPLRDGS